MDNWANKPQVIKGTFAEEIVDNYLESRGYIVYSPKTEGAHAFDKLAIKGKEQVVIAECKAKARRNFYPDTGIDVRHYNEYKLIQNKHSIPVFIFFIDEMMAEVYGNSLNQLTKPKEIKGLKYPLERNGIIYFPLENMRHVCKLTEEQVRFLKGSSTRRYNYAEA